MLNDSTIKMLLQQGICNANTIKFLNAGQIYSYTRSYRARNRTRSDMVKIIQPTNCFPCLLQVPVNTLEPTLSPQLPALLFPPISWSVQTECPDYLEIHASMFSSPSMPYRMRGKTSIHTLLVRIFTPAGRAKAPELPSASSLCRVTIHFFSIML
jgi:hypothetical protein